MIKSNYLAAIRKVRAHFSAIVGVSYLLVNSNQNYMEKRNSSIRCKKWREEDRPGWYKGTNFAIYNHSYKILTQAQEFCKCQFRDIIAEKWNFLLCPGVSLCPSLKLHCENQVTDFRLVLVKNAFIGNIISLYIK